MSVTVRQLNGDSSFLLIFSPESQPTPSDLRPANGAYSILIDPWIVGSSVTAAPWFAITDRVEPSCIQHLADLDDEPDVVICSQNKQDHTNKDTLLQLRPEGKTTIVAEPAAAKVIKSWNHFDPYRIHSMVKYDHRVKFGNTLRLHIPPLSPYGDAGEVTIAFVPAKNYMTGLHNAFGITYQPPTRTKAMASVSTVNLLDTKHIQLPTGQPYAFHAGYPPPLSPPIYPEQPFFMRDINNSSEETIVYEDATRGSSRARSASLQRGLDNDSRNPSEHNGLPSFDFDFDAPTNTEPFPAMRPLMTPPASPDAHVSNRKSSLSISSGQKAASLLSSGNASSKMLSPTISHPTSMVHPGRPKAISVLYTPHGMSLSDLKPYVQHHLVRLPGALPLTLMLHSFAHAENPWFFGGNIMTGAAGGVQIARALMAKCWVSAHDEEKDDRGLAVKLLKTRKTEIEDIQRQLHEHRDVKPSSWFCSLKRLNVGEEIVLSHKSSDMYETFSNSGYASSAGSVRSGRPISSSAG